MSDTKTDSQHLAWIRNRLVEVHGENENVDFIKRMDSIIKNMAETESTLGKPISPEYTIKKRVIPKEVFDSINELILKEWDGDSAKIYQSDIVELITSKNNNLTNELIFKKNYLDIEKIYEEQGWKVEFDQPSIGDNFKAYFYFEPK